MKWGNSWGPIPDETDHIPEPVPEDQILIDPEPVEELVVPSSAGKKGKKSLKYSSASDAVHSRVSRLLRDFSGLSYCPNSPRQPLINAYKIAKNTSRLEDCAPVFLAHTRLYVFADKYGIEILKCLALDKLHETLVGYNFFNDKCEDIVELVRFSYSNDNTPDGANDQLRDLVLQFVTVQQEKIGNSEPFLLLLEEGGPLVRDFWLSVRKSLLK